MLVMLACSGGVRACEFWRRLATGSEMHRDGAEARSQERLRY